MSLAGEQGGAWRKLKHQKRERRRMADLQAAQRVKACCKTAQRGGLDEKDVCRQNWSALVVRRGSGRQERLN